jgi:hypothetical protein
LPTALADIAESATGQLNNFEQDNVSIAGASDAGQTVQTTYTQFAQGRFDRAEMIAALADLQDDSNAFISLASVADENAVAVLHSEIDEGLPPAARRFKGRFKGLLDTFQSSLEPYKEPTDNFISVRRAVCILANVENWEEVNDENRTSEALFQLANVTELLNLTLHGRAAATLDYINLTFPTPFITDFATSWGGPLTEKTVELALSLRTQYLIDVLYKTMAQPDFDPDYVLRSVFYSDDGGLLALELTDEDGNLPIEWQPTFEQRMQDLRQHFSTEEPFVNLETLEAAFSWSAFRTELVQWAVIRANGLNMQISNRGGAKALQIHLQGGPPAAPISEKKRKSVGDKARQVSEMLANLEALKARRETPLVQRSAEVLENAQVEEIDESPIQTGYAPATADFQDDEQNILASQQSMQVLQTLRLHEAQSNKENIQEQQQVVRKGKSVDRQAGAQKVMSFEDTQIVNGAPGPSRKRGRQANDEEEEGSIQFEDDGRPQANKRARSNAPPDDFAEVAMQVAANAQLVAQAQATSSQPLPTRQPLTPRQNRPPPSTAPDARHLQSPIDDIPGSQTIASTQSKGPQVRVPFSVEENTRLLELITSLPDGTMRISWAQLEKDDLRHPEGPLLQRRGQVGLKDKARNLKMDFIK